MNDRDEFYVGYLDPAPPGIARWLRRFVACTFIVAAFLAGVLVASMQAFDPGGSEFTPERTYEGVIVLVPVPSLVIAREGMPGSMPGFSRYMLVGPGKDGADRIVAPFDGQAVRLEAVPVYRDGQTLLKLRGEPVHPLPPDGADHRRVAALEQAPKLLGAVTLTGEIVDPQCFFGLMKPGFGVPHRACAIRCLAGGVPPVLRSRDASGALRYHLLLGPQGERINRELLPWTADVLDVRGTEAAYGDLLAIHIDLASLRR
jgi:hypothetical protein